MFDHLSLIYISKVNKVFQIRKYYSNYFRLVNVKISARKRIINNGKRKELYYYVIKIQNNFQLNK